jgi:hopanoid biosynthesis associated RND transporter like protein HpnN
VLTRIIVSLVKTCTRHAWLTVIVGVILAVLAGFYSSRNFAITTDVNQLISTNLDWRQREIAYDKAFPGRNELILAVVEAATPELANQAGAALEQKLAPQTDKFTSVQRPANSAFFQNNGLLFLPTAEVAKITGQYQAAQPFLDILNDDPSLRGLTGVLEMGLQGAERGRFSKDSLARPLNMIADSVEQVLKTGDGTFSWRQLTSSDPLTPGDYRSLLVIQPILDYNALEPGKVATDAIRQAANDLNFARDFHAQVRLTGPVPIANEEFGTVQEGALVNGIGTVLVVLFILWLALHSPRIILAVFLTLVIGLSVTTAVALIIAGSFNLISIAFFVLFVGLGVDFGIQYSVRYRSDRYDIPDLEAALLKAGEQAAVPLTLAAVATAAGFLSFLPTHYKGVSELGKIAGAGMLIAYFMALTVLPALLKLLNPPGEKEPVGYAFLAPVDRFLEDRRIGIIATTLGVATLGLPLLYFLHFDFNPMNLRSPKVESIATYLDLRRDPNMATNAVDVLTPSLAAAKEAQQRLAKLPEVSKTTTLESFVPDDQPAKLGLIRKAASVLDPIFKSAPGSPASDADNVVALTGTAASLKRTAAKAGAETAAASNRLADALIKLAQSDKSVRDKVQNVFMSPYNTVVGQIRDSLKAQPITIKSLPPELVGEWVTSDGRARVEALPKGDPNDNETLRRFAAAVEKVEPTATGGPISILESGHTIVMAFIQAGCWALLSIAVLLYLVLKRITDVLLTLVPLILAGVVTLEICVLIGLPLNFANIIALPLLLGVGVAFKIYYVTAWRAGGTNLLQSSLTRAIFFSAMTTATAFGSLWLSSHPGTSSMGKLMALSLVTTLAAAVLFQPALMGRPRDVGDHTNI